MISYGKGYKKPTSILMNCPALRGLDLVCSHARHEEILSGTVRVETKDEAKYYNRTTLAGAYPCKLCRKWAQLIKPFLDNDPKLARANHGDFMWSSSKLLCRPAVQAFSRTSTKQQRSRREPPRLDCLWAALQSRRIVIDAPIKITQRKKKLEGSEFISPQRVCSQVALSPKYWPCMYSAAIQEFEDWRINSKRIGEDHRSVDEAMTLCIHELCEYDRRQL